jgi:hypothetical protein
LLQPARAAGKRRLLSQLRRDSNDKKIMDVNHDYDMIAAVEFGAGSVVNTGKQNQGSESTSGSFC